MSRADAAALGPAPEAMSGDRSRLAAIVIAGLAVLAVLAAGISAASGATGFMPEKILPAILDAFGIDAAMPGRDLMVIQDIRLPRAVLGFMIGAALATAGCVMQGLFRNPLADAGLVGTSSGAALGAVLVIVLGGPFVAGLPAWARPYALPGAAFFGALLATALLYVIATRDGRTSIATMLLAGIAIAALTAAGTGFLIFMSTDLQLRELTFWSLGSLGGATFAKVVMVLPFLLLSLAAFFRLAGDLDAILLGESEAAHLGVSVQTVKRVAIVAVAAAVGPAVAATGVIGFVGIVVPHLLRLLIGPLHGPLLPACALLGGAMLLAADMACRVVVAPAELPIGILTALIGAPFFLWLLLRRRSLLDL